MKWILKKNDIFPLNDILTVLKDGWEHHDKKAIVTVEFEKRPRTTGEYSQNHCLNGSIQQICEETGNDFATVKNYVKQQAIKRGYPVKMKNGEYLIGIDGNLIPISESDSTTVECGYLIEETKILASELGIILKE
jgi:hypothetical protein